MPEIIWTDPGAFMERAKPKQAEITPLSAADRQCFKCSLDDCIFTPGLANHGCAMQSYLNQQEEVRTCSF